MLYEVITGYHSEEIIGDFASATAIRKAIIEGRHEILSTMPNFVGGPLLYDDQFIIPQEALSDVMLYAIRRMSPAELAHRITSYNVCYTKLLRSSGR